MKGFNLNEFKNIPELEQNVLDFWKKNNIFNKSVDQRSDDNLYVFYDGPPFISGLPHYGHLLGSIAKDVIPRYWTMKGKKVERIWGWDAHGLTVENKVQKRLDLKYAKDVESFGLDKFSQECYKYTKEISSEWEWYVDHIGRWVDMEKAYKTLDQTYMESVIWTFKQLYDKGLIYEGVRTSLFCTTCGTPVSNFEVSMDNSYRDVEDPSVYVKFPIIKDTINNDKFLGCNLLAWTTTPWTLPSNRALVVDDKEMYSLVLFKDEKYILAKKRLDTIFKDQDYELVEEFLGSNLIGLSYEPPFHFYESKDTEFLVYSYQDMVTMDEGTGIVHSAPGFGMVDTEMGRHYDLTIMLTIDAQGKFEPGDKDTNPYAGMYYKKADPLIIEDLRSRNILFRDEKILHRFPYHDRCDTLLIQRAQHSWFINIQKIKDLLLKNGENINWIPEHLKEGRFGQGIQQAPDWCISRNRYWGTPMPVWVSEDNDIIVIGSKEELETLSGQKVVDFHRPYIDEIVIIKDGKKYTRIPEVLDAWMDSGSMPWAQIHYPFEHKEKFDKNFPGDYIVEYIAQTRAWFYVMHVLSSAVFGTNSFKNVICTGVMAGSDGRKMSKTYGNYTDPKFLLENYGGDALRLYLMSSPLMVGENANFDDNELKTKVRNVLNIVQNSLKYFVMYANANGWSKDEIINIDNDVYSNLPVLDKWILLKLDNLNRCYSENIESYLVPNAVREIETFVDDLSKWYIRRSRDRISSGDKVSLSVLYIVLVEFSKISASIIPFLSEHIYQTLVSDIDSNSIESVHLCEYPSCVLDRCIDSREDISNTDDLKIIKSMELVRDVCSVLLSLRTDNQISVRQVLSSAYVSISDEDSLDETYLDLIKEELNLKNVYFVSFEDLESKLKDIDSNILLKEYKNFKVALDINISDELKIEGLTREFIRKIQDLRKQQNLSVTDEINLTYEDTPDNNKIFELFGDDIKKKLYAKSIVKGTEIKIEKV